MQTSSTLHTWVFNSLGDQLAVIDQTGRIIDVNSAWDTFGMENGLPSEFACLGCNYLDTLLKSAAIGDSLAAQAYQGIMEVLAGKHGVFFLEYPCHSSNEERWFTMRCTPLHGDTSKSMFLISHHNITQRKLAEQQVEKLAMQDPLTGLANRRQFQFFLDREVRSNVRQKTPIGLILIDVDYFKYFNDEFGHPAGDQCLSKVGRILTTHARRPGDLAARIGGDEFSLILGNTTLGMARRIASSVLQAIRDLKKVDSDEREVTASLGVIALVPDDLHTGEVLFQEADKALYRAKAAGRNQVGYHSGDFPAVL
jgi:diguanylate cyclase (GGDEF)-like protein